MSKKIPYEVSGSSLVNLKAELFRKQEESKRRGENNQSGTIVQQGYVAVQNNSLKAKLKSKLKQPHDGSKIATSQPTVESAEDERSWEKARAALETKAKLYDKMASEQYTPDEGEEEHLLVDFSRKVQAVKYFDRKSASRCSSDSEHDSDTLGPTSMPKSADEEWTEYVDYLGRSRKCLRKDLASLKAQNEKLKLDMAHRSSPTHDGLLPAEPVVIPISSGFDFGQSPLEERTLLSDDMRREMERRLWEEESTSADGHITKGKVPVHYQSFENNEIRNLGVGYFKFSKDEDARNAEIETLNNLHQQTVNQRTQKDQLKAKRKAAMDARLAKVRERKMLKGEPVAELEKDDFEDDDFEKSLTSLKDKPPVFVEDLTPAPKPGTRLWDKGKVSTDFEDDKKYVAVRREERNQDFAPPSLYSMPAAPPKYFKHAYKQPPPRADFDGPGQPSTDFSNHAQFPAYQASQPWEKMQPWKERMKAQNAVESEVATHLQQSDQRRPWQFAPPPAVYSEETSDTRQMAFGRVSEDEIREEARKLFSRNQNNNKYL